MAPKAERRAPIASMSSCAKAMTMMLQMVPLDGVHQAQHQDAERHHHPLGRPARQAERVVIGAVHDAQSGQEEQEGHRQGRRIKLGVRQRQRQGRKPGRGSNNFCRCSRWECREIAPWHGTQPAIASRIDGFAFAPARRASAPDRLGVELSPAGAAR
jgi:hypothetical protein